MQPLTGVQILDASHVLAGPFASYQLNLLGAEVIRIDRITGQDFIRYHGGTDEMKAAGLGASYVAQNAGKTCIQLDFKDPRGAELFKRLAATSDVVLENFRPGTMERLGLGYEAIREIKQDIIYCSLNGYGANGPMRDAPAYDHIIQGFSGLMSLTGTEDSGPLRYGVPITDYLAGINGAFAILSAILHHRATGEGQYLEVTMLAAALPTMGSSIADYQTSGLLRGRMGNQPASDSPFAGRFDTADGQIVVTANTAAQTANMVKLLAISSLDAELAIVTSRGRLTDAQRERVAQTLREAFLRRSAGDWEEALSAASVPAAKVRGIDEILSHPQTQAIATMDRIAVAGHGQEIDVPGLAFTSNSGPKPQLPSPEVSGQSTARVLSELGLSKTELTDLARAGVIAGPDLPEPA